MSSSEHRLHGWLPLHLTFLDLQDSLNTAISPPLRALGGGRWKGWSWRTHHATRVYLSRFLGRRISSPSASGAAGRFSRRRVDELSMVLSRVERQDSQENVEGEKQEEGAVMQVALRCEVSALGSPRTPQPRISSAFGPCHDRFLSRYCGAATSSRITNYEVCNWRVGLGLSCGRRLYFDSIVYCVHISYRISRYFRPRAPCSTKL